MTKTNKIVLSQPRGFFGNAEQRVSLIAGSIFLVLPLYIGWAAPADISWLEFLENMSVLILPGLTLLGYGLLYGKANPRLFFDFQADRIRAKYSKEIINPAPRNPISLISRIYKSKHVEELDLAIEDIRVLEIRRTSIYLRTAAGNEMHIPLGGLAYQQVKNVKAGFAKIKTVVGGPDDDTLRQITQ